MNIFVKTHSILIITIFASLIHLGQCENYWTFTCNENKCMKQRLQPNETAVSLEVCELLCYEYSRIWPMPNGNFSMEKTLTPIRLEPGFDVNRPGSELLRKMYERFSHIINHNQMPNVKYREVPRTKIYFTITNIESTNLNLEVEERYQLKIEKVNDLVKINIVAQTVFGARHALETLGQLIVFDTVNKLYVIPTKVALSDIPKYEIRGLMLDTARNFISVDTIKRIIEGMAMNKLNTFHWHITDSQSFPFVSASIPELSGLGAYSSGQVYTFKDIKNLVEWARIRGVRIIPEFDGPAHVGEGWQDTGLVVCLDKQPWGTYCSEPPCGQFDLTKDELYSTLQLLYKDMIDAFDPVAFHFGGDEVNFNCWRSVESIRDWMTAHNLSWEQNSGHVELWNNYQDKIYNLFMQEAQKEIPAILWTSTLTDNEHLHNIPNDKYIVQVWTEKGDSTIKNLLENDYKIIISNYDALYLDCGFHSWTGGNGQNWCSPYKTWKTVYDNSPAKIVQSFGANTNKPHLIMGSIATLFTETVDDFSAESRIWPRAAALAERVWAEPCGDWSEAQFRLNSHQKRMARLGVNSDSLAPEWCYLHPGSCN